MAIKLGAVQLRIMRVLWEKGESSARTITETLCQESPIAHSTVQTLLRKLVLKRAVDHVEQDRTFIFRPLISESDASQSATQDLLSRVFNGSVTGLVAHLLENEEISEKELAELRALVNGDSTKKMGGKGE